jgi:hypothetical protein
MTVKVDGKDAPLLDPVARAVDALKFDTRALKSGLKAYVRPVLPGEPDTPETRRALFAVVRSLTEVSCCREYVGGMEISGAGLTPDWMGSLEKEVDGDFSSLDFIPLCPKCGRVIQSRSSAFINKEGVALVAIRGHCGHFWTLGLKSINDGRMQVGACLIEGDAKKVLEAEYFRALVEE